MQCSTHLHRNHLIWKTSPVHPTKSTNLLENIKTFLTFPGLMPARPCPRCEETIKNIQVLVPTMHFPHSLNFTHAARRSCMTYSRMKHQKMHMTNSTTSPADINYTQINFSERTHSAWSVLQTTSTLICSALISKICSYQPHCCKTSTTWTSNTLWRLINRTDGN